MEIQRLIGRSLRAVTDLTLLGERQVFIDCDVIVADGGTRTAAISGGWVALFLALKKLRSKQTITKMPIIDHLAAVSCGVTDAGTVLDLDYAEDSTASTDFNVVMTGSGKFVEIQGTAEKVPFDDDTLAQLLSVARSGITSVIQSQQAVVGSLSQ